VITSHHARLERIIEIFISNDFFLFYPQNVYTVSFPKPGFVELTPVPIDVGTDINLSFSTKNESGIILLGSGGTPTAPRRKRRQTGQVLSFSLVFKEQN
jgi:hypothetical protein